MNQRIEQLWKQAGGHYDSGNQHTWPEYTIDDPKKFAELIVKECAEKCVYVVDRQEILAHFGVEECRGWVCPKCGVDRTKDVCPQGHMAAVEGKCPMIGVAQ